MGYQMLICFMISKSKGWRSVVYLEGLLVCFGKNTVAASSESLFLYKNEKNELGFQVFSCKKVKVSKGCLFSKFVKHC